MHVSTENTPLYKQAGIALDRRVKDLIDRMNLDEKIGQLNQLPDGETNPNNLGSQPGAIGPLIGSYIIVPESTNIERRNELQRMCVEDSRLGIPAIFGSDVIHGYRTVFPIPLAQACSWNPELIRKSSRVAAIEARGAGVNWTFAPMIDIALDPRWGRIAEGFGESPYATGIFGAAAVAGFQGEHLNDAESIAACLKHFVGYGAVEGGREYSSTDISAQRLWELYLPPYEAGIKAGACTVMSAFNDLNGIPTSANSYMLTDVLRHHWGFQGFVVSDWSSVTWLKNQGFASDEADATVKAFMAGVDMDMGDGCYLATLRALVEEKRVSMDRIDDAVQRILRLKFSLGLFERPYAPVTAELQPHTNPDTLLLAEEFAAQSIVLLKNDGETLPIRENIRKIAVIGPLADTRIDMLGSWVLDRQEREEDVTSILAGIRERFPSGVIVTHALGCDIESDRRDGFEQACEIARDADCVILCLGESYKMSGEDASRSSIDLPGAQNELALEIATLGKPTVLLVSSGRPIALAAIEPNMNAILAVWQGGLRTGDAVAGLLLGKRNPSGRLAVTFPRTTGQIPISHHMRPRTRGPEYGLYQDIPTTPMYEFGHGLSYTTFTYGPIELERPTVQFSEKLTAQITVRNSGPRDGEETVFWFTHDVVASVTRPLKELKHFEKRSIGVGTYQTFRFEIDPLRDLSFPDASGNRILEEGEIVLMCGSQEARFTVVKDS